MGDFVRQFGGIEKQAMRKLDMLYQAKDPTGAYQESCVRGRFHL